MAELPTEEQLLTAVRDAGWLLENQALRVLAAADMNPRSSWAYEDPDEPTTSRELDVWSYRQLLRHEEAKVYVSARFLVECKQSSLPYVGVGHDQPDWRFDNPKQHVLPRTHVQVAPPELRGATKTAPAWREYGFRDLAQQHGDSPFRVTQLTRLDRKNGNTWEAKNTGVFTSLVYPLAKALLASQKNGPRESPAFPGPGTSNRRGWLDFALHFPVVLLSCPLYVVDATSSTPTVRQARWTTAVRDLKSKNVTGSFEFDLVTESAFADYVADRLGFASALADVVGADPLKYTGEDRLPE